MHKFDSILAKDGDLKAAKNVTATPISLRDWEAAVGTRIARRTQPIKLERGTLLVRTATAAWANELSLLCDNLLEQLQRHGMAIEALRFVVGRVERSEPQSRRHAPKPPKPPPVPLTQDLKERTATVDDDELRNAIEHAAATSLAVARKRDRER